MLNRSGASIQKQTVLVIHGERRIIRAANQCRNAFPLFEGDLAEALGSDRGCGGQVRADGEF